MSISVLCPSCNSKLNAPDSAAGKRVKCPKCQVLMELPAPEPEYELLDGTPPIIAKAKPKPPSKQAIEEEDDSDDRPVRKKQSRRAESDDEPDEDEDEDGRPAKRRAANRRGDEDADDDRPRRKGKKSNRKPKPKSNLPLIIGIGVGILVLAGGGFGVFMLLNNGDKSGPRPQSQQNATQPVGGAQRNESANWVQVDKPEFTAKMVAEPKEMSQKQGNGPAAMTIKMTVATRPDDTGGHVVMVFELSKTVQQQMLSADSITGVDKFLAQSPGGMGKITPGAETVVGGVKARAFTTNEKGKMLYCRALSTKGRLFFLMAGADNSGENDPHVQEFFNNFKPK